MEANNRPVQERAYCFNFILISNSQHVESTNGLARDRMTWRIKCKAKRPANQNLEAVLQWWWWWWRWWWWQWQQRCWVKWPCVPSYHVQLNSHVRWEDWAWDCLGISQQDLPDSEIQKLRDRSAAAAGSHCPRRNKKALSHCSRTISQKQALSLLCFLPVHANFKSLSHTHTLSSSVHTPPAPPPPL